jgi:hypothetical protein
MNFINDYEEKPPEKTRLLDLIDLSNPKCSVLDNYEI